MLFDSHAHLTHSLFDSDRGVVIKKLRDFDIKVINIGNDLEDSKITVDLVKKYPNQMWASVGIHPYGAEESDSDWNELRRLAEDESVVAIGECGLDYYNLKSQTSNLKIKDLQKEIFIKQVELAQELNKPLILHCRPSFGTLDAYEDAINIIENLKFKIENYNNGIAHFFSGSKEIAKKFLDLGFYISFAGPATVTRYVTMPKMEEAEFRQALKFEAQKYIPFSVSEINLDGCILRGSLPDNKMLVLVAAVKKEAAEQRLKLLQEAGLSANIIDLDAIALANGFNYISATDDFLKQKAYALLDVGASAASLAILEAGALVLSRDIHIAGNAITQKIMDACGVDFKAAEQLKIHPEPPAADKLNAALESVTANLAGEIRTSFDYYESQSSSVVSRIFLSGGAAKFAGLKDALANFLSIEVEYWDPVQGLRLAANIASAELKEVSAQLAVAVGLALRT